MPPPPQQQLQPQHIGIRGLYVYFPRLTVAQADLEAADGCAGKYTSGLGQQALAFCGDREDVVSMAATAVLRLLEGSGVALTDIGRLDVGTETGVDRSKSVMSHLAAYFTAAGNTSLTGSDHMHGCFGGTAALLSVADWVAGPSWDGRLGLAVATDVAVYPPGSPARATGGCGAAAMLVGPDAALVLEGRPWRGCFAAHAYDFFKPVGSPAPHYPVFDGPETTAWFTRAADGCAAHLAAALRAGGVPLGQGAPAPGDGDGDGSSSSSSSGSSSSGSSVLAHVDAFISHAPYNKIVRKVVGRLLLADGLRARAHQQQQQQQPPAAAAAAAAPSRRAALPPLPPEAASLDAAAPLPDSSLADKALERGLLAASSGLYAELAAEGAALQQQLGNLYTASLFSGLASLGAARGARLAGQRVLCFSFGSGVVASMFVLRGRITDAESSSSQGARPCEQQQQQQELQGAQAAEPHWQSSSCSLQHMAELLALPQRLANRLPRSVADFDAAMDSLAAAASAAPYTPSYGSVADLAPGTVHLLGIDNRFRRMYARTPL